MKVLHSALRTRSLTTQSLLSKFGLNSLVHKATKNIYIILLDCRQLQWQRRFMFNSIPTLSPLTTSLPTLCYFDGKVSLVRARAVLLFLRVCFASVLSPGLYCSLCSVCLFPWSLIRIPWQLSSYWLVDRSLSVSAYITTVYVAVFLFFDFSDRLLSSHQNDFFFYFYFYFLFRVLNFAVSYLCCCSFSSLVDYSVL